MQVDDPATREALGRLARNITSNHALWDDLLQEAMIHLWTINTRRPCETRSWYLQSCKFHLLHYLASGRSVDSIKRRDGQMPFETTAGADNETVELAISGESLFSYVCARELLSLLSHKLQPHERAVLECLADGLGPREIGRRLNISHTMVIKHRCRIASLLDTIDRPSRREDSLPAILGSNGANASAPASRARPVRRYQSAG